MFITEYTARKIRGREEILLGVTSRPYILKSTIRECEKKSVKNNPSMIEYK